MDLFYEYEYEMDFMDQQIFEFTDVMSAGPGHPYGPGMGMYPPPYMGYGMPGMPDMPPRLPAAKGPRPGSRQNVHTSSMACTERAPVYVFTTGLAIEAENAVKKGEFRSIIEFHQARCPRIKREPSMNNNTSNGQCNAQHNNAVSPRIAPGRPMDNGQNGNKLPAGDYIKNEPKSPAVSQAQNRSSSVGPVPSPRQKAQSPRGTKRGAASPASVPPHLGNPLTPQTPSQHTNPASVGTAPTSNADFAQDFMNGKAASGVVSLATANYNYPGAGELCNQPITAEQQSQQQDDPIRKMQMMTDMALPLEPPMKVARLDQSGATMGPLAAVKDSVMSPSMTRTMEAHYQQSNMCDPPDLTPEQRKHREQQLQKIAAMRNQFHLDGQFSEADRGMMAQQQQMMAPPGYRHPGPGPGPGPPMGMGNPSMMLQNPHGPMLHPQQQAAMFNHENEFSSDKARIEWMQMLAKHEQEKFYETNQNNGQQRMPMMGYGGPQTMRGMLVPPSGPAIRGMMPGGPHNGPMAPRGGMRGPVPRHMTNQHMMVGPRGPMMYSTGGPSPRGMGQGPGPPPGMMYSMPMDCMDPEQNPAFYVGHMGQQDGGPPMGPGPPYSDMYAGPPMSDFNPGANGDPSVMMLPPDIGEFGPGQANGKLPPGAPFDVDYAALRGPVPVSSIRGPHPPTVNNTYVNATMSIQQMTIQNMGPPIHHPVGPTTVQMQGQHPHDAHPRMPGPGPGPPQDMFHVQPLTNLDAKVPSQKLSYFPSSGAPKSQDNGPGPPPHMTPNVAHGQQPNNNQFFDNFNQELWATRTPSEKRNPPAPSQGAVPPSGQPPSSSDPHP